MRHQHLLREWPRCVPPCAAEPRSSEPSFALFFEVARHERTLEIEGTHPGSGAPTAFGRLDQVARRILIQGPRLPPRSEAQGCFANQVSAARIAVGMSALMEWDHWIPPAFEESCAMK
jgi:hypothetical protein